MNIADMHCDTISRIYHAKKRGEAAELCSNRFQLDLHRMKQAGYLQQNFALFVELGGEEGSPYEACRAQLRLFQEEMQKNAGLISQVRSFQEILQNEKQGKMSALLTIEEGEVCEGSLEKLREFYRAGVRMMTFTWNYENSLGAPAEPAEDLSKQKKPHSGGSGKPEEPTDKGLTETGVAFLGEMERLGMIVDVSHLSDQGIWDVCGYAKKPFAASHSNARSLCARGRNLPDALIREIAERGGVIGANYYGPFLTGKAEETGEFYGRAADVAAHIRYLADMGGIACVGLGSDFDGIDDNLEIKDCTMLELLWQSLGQIGFHEREREAVFSENVLRLYRSLL